MTKEQDKLNIPDYKFIVFCRCCGYEFPIEQHEDIDNFTCPYCDAGLYLKKYEEE